MRSSFRAKGSRKPTKACWCHSPVPSPRSIAARAGRSRSPSATTRVPRASSSMLRSGVDQDVFSKDQRVRVPGLVGQRASRSGAADGHRVWPRGPRDIEVLREVAGPAPRPPATTHRRSRRALKRPRRKAIRNAMPGHIRDHPGHGHVGGGLRRQRRTQGDGPGPYRSHPGALSGRRRPPRRSASVIRAWGDVETWFDAPQLEVDV